MCNEIHDTLALQIETIETMDLDKKIWMYFTLLISKTFSRKV